MEWNHQFIETNGIRMHLVRHGAGHPVVLLHGWPEFWYAWRKNIPTLAEQFDVIAPDLRGFGQSDKPRGTASEAYTIDHHVEDLKGLIDALGLPRIGLVSHDVGSSVAQAFTRRYPDRVAGLFFFNVLYPGVAQRLAGPENMTETWYQGFHQQPWAADLIGSSRAATRIYFGNMLSHWAHDPRTFDDDLEAWVDNFLATGNLQGGFNWYTAIFPARLAMMRGDGAAPPPIPHPTRVRWGASEPFMKPDYADRLGESFTDLDYAVVPEAGHFVHYEQPDFTNREIAGFFEGLAAAGRFTPTIAES